MTFFCHILTFFGNNYLFRINTGELVCLFNYLILSSFCNRYPLKRNYGIGFASLVKWRCYSMEAFYSAHVREENYDVWKEDLVPLLEKETVARYPDHYDEPSYLFRGVIIGLFICLPFWAIIFRLIT